MSYDPAYYREWRERNRGQLKTYHARYFQAHRQQWKARALATREQRLAAQRCRRALRRDEINAKARERRRQNLDHVRAVEQALRKRNIARKRQRDAEWRRKNPEKYARAIAAAKRAKPDLYRANALIRSGRRRARIKALPVEPVSQDRIYARDRGLCHLCHQLVERAKLSLDHLIPVARGGPWAEWNLAAAHRDCNRRRRDRAVLTLEDRAHAEAYVEAA